MASRSAVVQAKRATAEDLQQYPARLALADAMKHVLWVAENYDALDREFPNHPWNAVMVSSPDKPQICLPPRLTWMLQAFHILLRAIVP